MKFIHFFYSLITILVLNIIFFHKSLNNYIEQKYHISLFPSTSEEQTSFQILDEEPPLEEDQKITRYPYIEDGKIILKPQTSFLLIGDSMMQGIGMNLVPRLKKLDMQVNNIAKQSTGLTYTKFFDWPQELEKTLQEEKIDIIIIMLGANDPWNINKKIEFGTEQWDAIYKERIQTILQIANHHQALVVWYEVPLVRNEKLSVRIPHLNALYKEAALSSGNLFIETNFIFAPDNNYTAFMQQGNKSISLRANDGIHFTRSGSKILTNLFIERLEIIPDETQDLESQNINTQNKENK